MTPENFDFIANLIHQESGIILTQEKTYLIESRLTPIGRNHSSQNIDEFIDILRKKANKDIIKEIVNSMTTNESLFFRDQKPFNNFQNIVLPNIIKARHNKKTIRIWSAAASSGQEPYSLSILLKEISAQIKQWKIEIVGTDICTNVLERAKLGIYSQFEVQRGLPIGLLMKYFSQSSEGWHISDEIKSMVTFNYFNLMNDMKELGNFDIIFCRNVLIYFNQDTKRQVLNQLASIMAPDGYLFLGGAESLLGITEKFKPLDGYRGIYVPTN